MKQPRLQLPEMFKSDMTRHDMTCVAASRSSMCTSEQSFSKPKHDRRKEQPVFFLTTTDRGSNEVNCRKQIMVQISRRPNVIYLEADCFEHSGHLVTLAGLVVVDKLLKELKRGWHYYSSLAVMATTVRDLSTDVFETWVTRYGASSAMESVTKLAPRCISGRWRAIDNVEDYMLAAGFDRWQQVLTDILTQKLEIDAETVGLLQSMNHAELRQSLGSKKGKAKSNHKAKEIASAHLNSDEGGAEAAPVLS